MMTPELSRRRWMQSLALIGFSWRLASAGPPTQLAPHTSSAETATLPVPSRIYRLRGETATPIVVTAIAADPRGELLAVAGDDHQIRILQSSNFATIERLHAHRDVIRTLAFDPAGEMLVSAGNDGQVILWDRSNSFAVKQKIAGGPALARVVFSPDGTEIATAGFDDTVYLVGRRSRRESTLQCGCRDLRAVAYREDAKMIAVAGRSGKVSLFDFSSRRLLQTHALHSGRIHDLVFHRQSNIAICVAEDGAASVLDTGSGRLIHRVQVTTGKLFAAAVLNSHCVAMAGSDDVIRIVNTDEGRVIKVLEGHRGSISTLAASPDVLFSGSFDATLRRWPVAAIVSDDRRIAESESTVDR